MRELYSGSQVAAPQRAPAVSGGAPYVPLGRTGMMVSPVALGTMMFGSAGNPDRDECVRLIHRALDHGINFLDTADMYSAGESEEIVGAALQGRRDEVILATKGHFALARSRPPSGCPGSRTRHCGAALVPARQQAVPGNDQGVRTMAPAAWPPVTWASAWAAAASG